jgi:hypothetical protein
MSDEKASIVIVGDMQVGSGTSLQMNPDAMVDCPGCGKSYVTMTVNWMHPHNFAECAAYRRGFEDGKKAGKQ